MTETAVFAAGGVVWRVVDGKLRILVIHRTAYADVTLPKGKVDPGETLAETAVREIFEGRPDFEAHMARVVQSDWGRATRGIPRDYMLTEAGGQRRFTLPGTGTE